MVAFASQPRLRCEHHRARHRGQTEKDRASRRSLVEAAGEDLQIALDERVSDEEAIVRLFDPEDRSSLPSTSRSFGHS